MVSAYLVSVRSDVQERLEKAGEQVADEKDPEGDPREGGSVSGRMFPA
jgi:hypothetical protein